MDFTGDLLKNQTNSLMMSAEGYILSAIFLSFIGIFGFSFNLLVIILICKDKQLQTPFNTVLFNLVCSDFSVSILGNPWTVASAVSHGWFFNQTTCKMYGFFMSLLGITSITTLTVLAFERYIMVSRPFKNITITQNRSTISIIFIWIYSLSLTLPPLFGWGEYVNEAANISCSVNWEDRTYNAMTYIVFLFVFGLALPMIIIMFSYLNILITVKNRPILSDRITRTDSKLTVMILLMITAFLIAWTPYAIMALIIQFGDHRIISPSLAVIPALIAKSSICYNPIIYVGMNTQFRQSWKELFKRNKEERKQQTHVTNFTGNPTSRSSMAKVLEFSNLNELRQTEMELKKF